MGEPVASANAGRVRRELTGEECLRAVYPNRRTEGTTRRVAPALDRMPG